MAKKTEIENLEKTIQKLREKSLAENDALKKLIAALQEEDLRKKSRTSSIHHKNK
jgi:hypothetical protein